MNWKKTEGKGRKKGEQPKKIHQQQRNLEWGGTGGKPTPDRRNSTGGERKAEKKTATPRISVKQISPNDDIFGKNRGDQKTTIATTTRRGIKKIDFRLDVKREEPKVSWECSRHPFSGRIGGEWAHCGQRREGWGVP